MDKLIGKVLDGRYTIREIIGTGGMSVVYKAEDSLEDRYVAVKVLKEEFVNEPKFRRRFLNESRAIAMLSHDNIVDVVDVNFEGDIQYIVMEYIEGITLKEYITSKSPLNIDEALDYCTQILQALKHAHERGVVHRDIKPQNIMLLPDNKIKVTDFGIAHVSNFETVTMSDMAIGSVHYISPEQAKGMPTDEKSDIYSTGIMLYEMITGKLPFEGDTAVSVALKQVQQEPVKPSQIIPEIPMGVEQIIMKSIRKKVSMRYQNASEMLEDIEKYRENNDIVFDYGNEDEFDGTLSIEKIRVDDDIENSKMNKKKLLQNRMFAVGSGAAAALVLVLIGFGVMHMIASNFSDKYIEVPGLVGKAISAVKADINVNKYFTIKEEMKYDDNVEYGLIISQNPEEGHKYEEGKEIKVVVSQGKQMTTVPYMRDMTLSQAKIMLSENNLLYELRYQQNDEVAENCVISSEPAAEASVQVNSVVILYISEKPIETKVTVPSVVGKYKEDAIKELTKAGLKYTINESYSDNYEIGQVISQSPVGLESVEQGTEVLIIVCKGKIPASEPQPTPEPEEPLGPDPETPSNPDDPENPEDPGIPENPANPMIPQNPNDPSVEIPDPEEPNIPAQDA